MKLKGLLFVCLWSITVAGCGNEMNETAPAGAAQTQAAEPAPATEPETIIAESEAIIAESDPEVLVAEAEPTALEPTANPSTSTTAVAPSDAAAEPRSRFQLGKHYQRLTPTQPTSSSPDKVEVAEVFWYGCSHCYNFDPYVEKWLVRKPDDVSFVRIPAVWNPLVKLHARAFYTAQALGREEAMHTAFFREIHLNGNALDTEAKLAEFFGRFDVSAEDFQAAFNSFAVHTKLQQAETLARRYRVTSVPLVVVNGKYTTSATMTGGYDTLMEVIDDLVGLERGSS